jgi:hypothetical protein
VEILKFAEPPKRSSRTSTQKRGGLMPLLAVVVSVAVVGGMSTTLAGTISLNTSGSVEFGQGVITTAACDTSIKILPVSAFDSQSASVPFYVEEIELQDIGIKSSGTDTATAGGGCLGKRLTLKAYKADGTQLTIIGSSTSIFIEIPDSGTAVANVADGTPNDKDVYADKTAGITILQAGGFGAAATTIATGLGVAGNVKIGNLAIPGTVTRITLESSEASTSTT